MSCISLTLYVFNSVGIVVVVVISLVVEYSGCDHLRTSHNFSLRFRFVVTRRSCCLSASFGFPCSLPF